MQFRILGPLEAWEDGHEVDLGAGRQRALLAYLLVHAGEVVSADRLVDELWDQRAPPSATKLLQNQVLRLRRVLPPDSIVTRGSGYLLRAGETDALEFERLLELARGQQPHKAAGTLQQALVLWRGSPLTGFEYEEWAQPEIVRLQELRLAALEERIEVDLQLGGADRLIPELEALVAQHPLRERLRAQLMLALYRSGRQVDALATYSDARRQLVEDLGIEPGPELQELQRRILAHDPELAPAPRPHPLAAVARRGRWLVVVGVVLLLAAAAAVGAAFIWRGESSRMSVLAANSVGFIDARGVLTRTQIPVGAAPTSAAFGEGALWVANANADTVSRANLRANSVETIPDVGHSPSGIAVGGGGVWVADYDDGTVAWISPQTNSVVRQIGVGAGPIAVAYGYGAVWVTNSTDRSVTRIEPDSGAAKTIPVDATGRGIALGGGFVWVTDESSRTVVQIDPATDKIAGRASVGNGPTGIAYGDGSIWVANALDDTVTQIDATTLATRNVITVADGPSTVAFGDGTVWVSAEFGDRVVRIDPRSGTIVGSTPIGNRPEGLAAGAGGVWVAVQSSGRGHEGGRLVVIGTSNLDSVDPALADSTDSGALISDVYDGLTDTRRSGGSAGTQIVPDLAVALPAPTDDGRSYTFHLRTGIRYSNGTPLRAEDFRRALEREFFLDGPLTSEFATVVGAGRCKPHRTCDLSRGMIVRGPSTLTIRLSTPDPTLLSDIAGLVPVPADTPLTDVGTKAVPSTGAYEIQSYAPGRLLTIVRNSYFHLWSQAARPRGYPDEIDYRILKNPGQAVHEVLTGKADLLTEGVPARQIPELAARFPQLLHFYFQQATVFAFLNVRRPPFNHLGVREALNYAVDRRKMTVLDGGALIAQPTCQLVPPTVQGYVRHCPYTANPDRDGDWSGPDLTKARTLIAASHTRGQSVVVWTTFAFRRDGLYLVALLRQLGYRARPHYVSDLNSYFARLVKTPSAQAGIAGWFGGTAADMFETVGCRFGPNNLAHFCDPQIDAQVARLAREQPSPAYAKLAATIDREIVEQAPWVPLFTPRLADLASPRVGNYQVSPDGYPLLDQMWVK